MNDNPTLLADLYDYFTKEIQTKNALRAVAFINDCPFDFMITNIADGYLLFGNNKMIVKSIHYLYYNRNKLAEEYEKGAISKKVYRNSLGYIQLQLKNTEKIIQRRLGTLKNNNAFRQLSAQYCSEISTNPMSC